MLTRHAFPRSECIGFFSPVLATCKKLRRLLSRFSSTSTTPLPGSSSIPIDPRRSGGALMAEYEQGGHRRKRHRGLIQDDHDAPEPPSTTAIDQLTVSVRDVHLEDTPKSRRQQGRGLRTGLHRKRLFPKSEVTQASPLVLQKTPQQYERLPNWTDAELSGLTEFLMLHTDGKTWVAHKDNQFWDQAGAFLQQLHKTSYRRSGNRHTLSSIIPCLESISYQTFRHGLSVQSGENSFLSFHLPCCC